ncbi:isopentenyl diphosphate isomerase/L-lactate dehydrogenase-like FMN-dependent dehydrogenase [Thermocatellispora tengchongensis]|uniref:Isopentenyl diphosphate isomerase/L-lactate dehydrogenase-like FMN-dependent dehydrogenase n=1 Tax=Thermocatellispora tengchongensis TaxID=1073253 RepID=A0A840P217_9ACTN|nr:lactate 2-monooxygenase [Thermocatellispora tengchongensis]MBB5131287.1 isopentenyl diphosphate isomerase/L-lactate dehydrogenase-like FMN-dependent dehydrogenase [Thermocatellispora tengchongensis]
MSAEPPLSAYQFEIYLDGLAGRRPAFPTDLTMLEEAARARMEPEAFGYVSGGAGSGATVRANREAFDRWRIVPRMLRDVSKRDLGTTVLGTAMPAPVMTAPVGVLSIAHPEGELAVARAAASLGVPIVLSTAASYTMEEVAEAGGDGPRWYQLYWPKDRDLAISLLSRAEAAGYSALVVTLDTWMLAWRPRDLDHAYLPFLRGVGVANYFSDPAFRAGLARPPEEDVQAAVLRWADQFADPRKTWADLAFLREHWRGPIALKGILHPDDARRAVDAGMDGIVVSNHGGRQVDGSVGALDALPGVVAAVGDRAEVLLDSGVRTGADVVKALALGARAVLVGRPYAYGLALGGEDGVRHVLRCLLAELDLTLALSGQTTIAELNPGLLAPA